ASPTLSLHDALPISGRLQSVTEPQNPRYYHLIEAFRDATGVPLVLNTSFNENEPVVNTPGQALDCFLRTKMDLLVMGDLMIRRRSEEHTSELQSRFD